MSRLLKSFAYAAKGICRAVVAERNFRFHLCVAAYVCGFSAFYSLTRAEYALLALVIGLVLALELLNSAVERMVDGFAAECDPKAGLVKDMAAGAVLAAAAAAAVCGVLLFWDGAVFGRIVGWFGARPGMAALLGGSLVLCVWFVFFFGGKKVRR